LAYVEKEH
jgi:hypothetical protein